MQIATHIKTHIGDIGQAMAEGRWADVLANVAPDVIAHVPAVGDLHGVEALATFLTETAAKADNGEHFELLDTLTGNDHAALYFRITASRPGRAPLDNLTLHLVRLEDTQIAEIWFHNFDGPSVAAFWA
jgi:predicted SnoaL-like aldol condensation-catalyzing enzyme